MENEVSWMKPGKVLYVHYRGYQTAETIWACMDRQAEALDTAAQPVVVLVNWLDVTGSEAGAIKGSRGHRGYSHPMVARAVLVGMNQKDAFENELSVHSTRQVQHTRYFDTLEAATDFLRNMLEED